MQIKSAIVSLAGVILTSIASLASATRTPVNRVVGVDAVGGGVSLVKSFVVPENTEIQAVEFVGNDLNSIIPRLSILQGPLVSLNEGQRLLTKDGIRHENDSHRARVSFNPIRMATTTTVYVVVELPAEAGPNIIGTGAGIGAQSVEEPTGSFIAFDARSPLTPIALDLAIDLVLQSHVGKAGAGEQREDTGIPVRTFLAARTPSPVAAVAVEFGLRESGFVDLSVYDVGGRKVRSLVRSELPAGVHSRTWDGVDGGGRQVSSGIYLARLHVGEKVFTQKLVLTK
jgi:hypothetical protein